MSLDVYLEVPGFVAVRASSGIYIRENGQMREISRDEWDARFPNKEPVVVFGDDRDNEPVTTEVYSANITHNLAAMADAANLYDVMWRPDENGIETAHQLIEPLATGLKRLKSDPDRFTPFNPPNGWGDYTLLVRFTEAYLEACKEFPDAAVRVWR